MFEDEHWVDENPALVDKNATQVVLPSDHGFSYQACCTTCGWDGLPHRFLERPLESGKSAREFSESAMNGCWRCIIAREYWKKLGEPPDWRFDGQHFFAVLRRQSWDSCETPQLPGNAPCRLRLFSGDTSSSTAFNWALRVLSSCDSCHMDCRRRNDSKGDFLPTRLIQVDALPATLDIILVETETLLQSGIKKVKYLTLSHCWGNTVPQCQTTSTTLEQRKLRIAWGSLPKTFQDAVTFTRKLKCSYLWIDTLCIIQQDEEDWLRESSRMQDVYSHSYLTLAATSSIDGSGGLFSKVDPPSHITTIVHNDIEFLVFAAGHPYENHIFVDYHRVYGDEHRRNLTTHPLLTRGWVYQERLLSTRVLHFTRTELAWECCDLTTCECSHTWATAIYRKHFFPARHGSGWAEIVPWRGYIQEFTRLSLTKDEDRLQAFAGIAKAVYQEKPGITYYAGLWSCDFALDLLWFRNRQLSPHSVRPRRWCAPSWSWASVMCAVNYQYVREEALFEILSASINPVGIDSFGPVIGGRVRLRGQLIEAEIRERHGEDDGTTSGLYVLYDTIEFEFVADVSPECPGSGQCIAEYRNGHRVYVLAGAKQGNPYVELGCLVLCEQRNDSDSPTPAIRTFRRIGFARWIGKDFEDKELDKIITLFRDSVELAII